MDNDILNQLQNLINNDDDTSELSKEFQTAFSIFDDINKLIKISRSYSGVDSNVAVESYIEGNNNVDLGVSFDTSIILERVNPANIDEDTVSDTIRRFQRNLATVFRTTERNMLDDGLMLLPCNFTVNHLATSNEASSKLETY